MRVTSCAQETKKEGNDPFSHPWMKPQIPMLRPHFSPSLFRGSNNRSQAPYCFPGAQEDRTVSVTSTLEPNKVLAHGRCCLFNEEVEKENATAEVTHTCNLSIQEADVEGS